MRLGYSQQYDENAQATYWFNNVTYEATWTPPPGFDAGPPQASGEWASYMDPEGTVGRIGSGRVAFCPLLNRRV